MGYQPGLLGEWRWSMVSMPGERQDIIYGLTFIGTAAILMNISRKTFSFKLKEGMP
jgi:hypothetical protein